MVWDACDCRLAWIEAETSAGVCGPILRESSSNALKAFLPAAALIHPVRNEDVRFVRHFSVSPRHPNQLLPIGTENREAIKPFRKSEPLQVFPVQIDRIQFEISHPARSEERRVGKECRS